MVEPGGDGGASSPAAPCDGGSSAKTAGAALGCGAFLEQRRGGAEWEGAVSVCVLLEEVELLHLVTAAQMQPRHEDMSAGGTWRSLPGVVASSALLELDACRGVTWKRGVEGCAVGVGHVLCPETGRKSQRVGMFGPLEDRLTLALSVVGGACLASVGVGGSGRRSGMVAGAALPKLGSLLAASGWGYPFLPLS